MRSLAKLLGLIIGFTLYPFFWMLECVLLFIAAVFETVENLLEADDK